MNSIQRRQEPLDSHQLNAFVTLSRTGSYKETAAELFLTHSAISHAMRTLERELGCRLLTRMCKRVVLTEMGEALLHHAEQGLQEFAKAREHLEQLRQWGGQRLRVGAGAAVSRELLPLVLHHARTRHPRLHLTARVVRPWEMVDALANGQLDLVIGEPQKTKPEISFTPLFESPLRILAGREHRWAIKGKITPGELAKEPCILTDKAHPTRLLIDRYFAADEIELNAIAEIDSFDAIKELVKTGSAISILPLWVMKDELASGVLTDFPPGRRALLQTWGLYRWRSHPVTSVENSFRVLFQEAAAKLQCNTLQKGLASIGTACA
jgi:DNA-binding transcriptional LysR family regulator